MEKELYDPATGETRKVLKAATPLLVNASSEREAYLQASNDRLREICTKKIDTTMIGSLDAVESEIAVYSEGLSESEKLKLKGLYSKIRSRVLDNGNNQKRAITEEFKHYIIDWQKYTMTMQVKPRN